MEVVQRDHRLARRNADSAKASTGFAIVVAPLSHGTSLFALLFSIPKYVHYTRKKRKYEKVLRNANVAPLSRTKRDVLIPVAFGTVTAVLGAGVPGVEHVAHGAEHLANAADLSGAANGSNPAELFFKGVSESLGDHANAIAHPGDLVHDGVQNLWQQGNYIEATADGLPASTDAEVLHVGLKEILLNWDVGEQVIGNNLAETHFEGAIAHIDALILEVMNGTFTENEMQSIGKNLTSALIAEVMGGVLSSTAYQILGEGDDTALKQQFREMVLSASNNAQRRKQIVLSIGDMNDAESKESFGELAIHHGERCDSCGTPEIRGTRFKCNDCDKDISYCFNCFMVG